MDSTSHDHDHVHELFPFSWTVSVRALLAALGTLWVQKWARLLQRCGFAPLMLMLQKVAWLTRVSKRSPVFLLFVSLPTKSLR